MDLPSDVIYVGLPNPTYFTISYPQIRTIVATSNVVQRLMKFRLHEALIILTPN